MVQNNQINTPTPFAINKGGTGVTSVTTAPTASAWSGWDASKNMSANSFIPGYTTTVTSASPVVLTVASTWQQYFTGSTTQTVTLPVTSTLVLGQSYFIVNNSSNTTTVNSSGGNAVQVMTANTTALVTCILTSGTTAASWSVDYTTETSGANFPVNTNITSMTGLTGTLQAPTGVTSSAGVNLLTFTYTASAVNYIQVLNNITNASPSLSAVGTDSNIILQLSGKGTGGAAVQGTSTNDNATAGFLGEYKEATKTIASPQSVSNNTATDVITLSLTAGDWDVTGTLVTSAAGTTTTSLVVAWLSTTSATLPTAPNGGSYSGTQGVTLTAGSNWFGSVGKIRVSVNTTTTVYLSCYITFAISTMSAAATIQARRIR